MKTYLDTFLWWVYLGGTITISVKFIIRQVRIWEADEISRNYEKYVTRVK